MKYRRLDENETKRDQVVKLLLLSLLFKNMLRGLNETFYHKTVTTLEIEQYISQFTHKDLTTFFDQYLRTIQIPTLEYTIQDDQITYRWKNIVKDFDMPVKLQQSERWIFPTSQWKTEKMDSNLEKEFSINRNFYIRTEQKSLH